MSFGIDEGDMTTVDIVLYAKTGGTYKKVEKIIMLPNSKATTPLDVTDNYKSLAFLTTEIKCR